MTPAELTRAILAARDTFVVPPGDYGDFRIRRRADLELVCAEGAKFRSLTIAECRDLALRVVDSHAVHLLRPSLRGGPAIWGLPEDTDPSVSRSAYGDNIIGWPTGRGVTIEANSTRVTLEAATIREFFRGVVVGGEDHAIRGCDIGELRGSTLSGSGQRLVIDANRFHRSRPWKFGGKGDHGDYIHLFTNGFTVPMTGVRITRNVMQQLDGGALLGIYLDDNTNNIGYVDTLVEGNILHNGSAQAIRLENVDGRVIGNVAIPTPGIQLKQAPSIVKRNCPASLVIEDNVMGDAYGTFAAHPQNTTIGAATLRSLGAV
jgi:hypothetical protein